MVEPLLHFAVPFVSLRAFGLDQRKALFFFSSRADAGYRRAVSGSQIPESFLHSPRNCGSPTADLHVESEESPFARTAWGLCCVYAPCSRPVPVIYTCAVASARRIHLDNFHAYIACGQRSRCNRFRNGPSGTDSYRTTYVFGCTRTYRGRPNYLHGSSCPHDSPVPDQATVCDQVSGELVHPRA